MKPKYNPAERTKPAMDMKKALNATAALCSKKEHATSDIRRKLENWGISAEEQEKIIDFLQKNKFLDDRRFARFYARDKFRFNKWGKQKIAASLRQKQINETIISEALNQLETTDYSATCLHLLQQKLKSSKESDPMKQKAKLIRFGLSRGFDYETIQKCYNQLKKDTTEQDFRI